MQHTCADGSGTFEFETFGDDSRWDGDVERQGEASKHAKRFAVSVKVSDPLHNSRTVTRSLKARR
jgi:hypothetical protein